jgi:hypothetical protein
MSHSIMLAMLRTSRSALIESLLQVRFEPERDRRMSDGGPLSAINCDTFRYQ